MNLVEARRDDIARRTGLRLEVTRVAVRSLSRERPVDLADGVLTRDAAAVVDDPDVDVVVEVIGGIEPARELILAALKSGKPVVTGNKELLANHGAELYAAADGAGVDLLFEAAVAGGVPILRPLRESLAGEDITRVMGIVNGTTNFILTRMTEEGSALRRGAGRGPGPGLRRARPDRRRRGLRRRRQGRDHRQHRVRRAGRGRRRRPRGHRRHHRHRHRLRGAPRLRHQAARGGRALRRAPTAPRSACGSTRRWCPPAHPLASVRDSFNAVFVEGAAVGDLMFYGRGAGGDPTAVRRARRPHRRGGQPAQGHPRHHRHAGPGPHPARSTRSPPRTT